MNMIMVREYGSVFPLGTIAPGIENINKWLKDNGYLCHHFSGTTMYVIK